MVCLTDIDSSCWRAFGYRLFQDLNAKQTYHVSNPEWRQENMVCLTGTITLCCLAFRCWLFQGLNAKQTYHVSRPELKEV